MKKVKYALWVIILGFIGLIVYQNREWLFGDKPVLGIDLGFRAYQVPEVPVGIYLAVVFVLGWLCAYFSSLVGRFKTGKTIKKLKETIHAQETAIDGMKKDIEALKPRTEPPEPMAFDEPDAPGAATGAGTDDPGPGDPPNGQPAPRG